MEGWTVCVEHRGRHGMLDGRCVFVGADVPRPTRWLKDGLTCDRCGDDLDAMRIGHGRVMLLSAGTDVRHAHPADMAGDRMEQVANGLEALQRTLAAMLAERRESRPSSRPPEQPTSPAPASSSILDSYRE